jgi:hypothetical protein
MVGKLVFGHQPNCEQTKHLMTRGRLVMGYSILFTQLRMNVYN